MSLKARNQRTYVRKEIMNGMFISIQNGWLFLENDGKPSWAIRLDDISFWELNWAPRGHRMLNIKTIINSKLYTFSIEYCDGSSLLLDPPPKIQCWKTSKKVLEEFIYEYFVRYLLEKEFSTLGKQMLNTESSSATHQLDHGIKNYLIGLT